mmetsp:Transcript_46087/g.73178  ORF Transcript_46087/g.73178 Transcript_46087/m.73178 type:complete len:191 (+) Transcript_46087:58-630(+)
MSAAELKEMISKMEHKDLKEMLSKMSDEHHTLLTKALTLAGKPGSNMRGAIWLWNEEACAEALGENELEGEIPKCTGKQLLMEEVKFEKGDDQKKVDTMVKRVIQMFMEDQAQAEIPYEPPESAKGRAVWMWSQDQVKEFLGEVEIEVDIASGKELLTDGRNKFKDGQDEKVQEVLGNIGKMLVQDIIMA